jgi:hypothetical protein
MHDANRQVDKDIGVTWGTRVAHFPRHFRTSVICAVESSMIGPFRITQIVLVASEIYFTTTLALSFDCSSSALISSRAVSYIVVRLGLCQRTDWVQAFQNTQWRFLLLLIYYFDMIEVAVPAFGVQMTNTTFSLDFLIDDKAIASDLRLREELAAS